MKQLPPYNDNKMMVAYYRYSSASQNEASIAHEKSLHRRVLQQTKGDSWWYATASR
ncbi:hypothetical protein R6G85_07385 [Actinotignum urinale]|nr:hypothetical protein [Actinotignum urinale]